VQDAACKAALPRLTADPGFSACLGGTAAPADGFTQTEDIKAPAGEGFCQSALTKKATAFQQNEPQLPQPLAAPSLSCAASLVNWPLRI